MPKRILTATIWIERIIGIGLTGRDKDIDIFSVGRRFYIKLCGIRRVGGCRYNRRPSREGFGSRINARRRNGNFTFIDRLNGLRPIDIDKGDLIARTHPVVRSQGIKNFIGLNLFSSTIRVNAIIKQSGRGIEQLGNIEIGHIGGRRCFVRRQWCQQIINFLMPRVLCKRRGAGKTR